MQQVADERRLARAGDPGDGDQRAERDLDVDAPEVVGARPHEAQHAPPGTAPGGHGDPLPAREPVARERPWRGGHLADRAGGDDLPSLLPGSGPELDDPVGRPHRRLVVFDHDQRVARVPETPEHGEQPLGVPCVQADRRLVEDVEDVHDARDGLRRQLQALRLAAGEARPRPVERQVAEPEIEEHLEPHEQLAHEAAGDLACLALERRLEAREHRAIVAECRRQVVGDRAAVDRDELRRPPQARAATGRAHDLVQEALEALPSRIALALGVRALDRPLDVDEGRVEVVHGAAARFVPRPYRHVVAAEDQLAVLGGELPPRHVEVDADRPQRRQLLHPPAERPGRDGALREGLPRVGHDGVEVDLESHAEPGAVGAGAVRGVEGEVARGRQLAAHPVGRAHPGGSRAIEDERPLTCRTVRQPEA